MANIAEWTSAGTYSYTVPSNVTKITVETRGGGGGGGGGGGSGHAVYNNAGTGGSGGSAGATNTATITVTPGSSITVIVGDGGNGGAGGYAYQDVFNDWNVASASNGSTGGQSSIAGSCAASGGSGGEKGYNTASIYSPTAGTAGATGDGAAGKTGSTGGAGGQDSYESGGAGGAGGQGYGAGGGGGGGAARYDNTGGTGGKGACGHVYITAITVSASESVKVAQGIELISKFVKPVSDTLTIKYLPELGGFSHTGYDSFPMLLDGIGSTVHRELNSYDALTLVPICDDYNLDNDGNRILHKNDTLTVTGDFDQHCLDYPYNVWDLPVRQVYGKVLIQYTDPLKDTGITITSSGAAYDTFTQQACDNVEFPDQQYLEIDQGLTDGNYYLAPNTARDGAIGWWSSLRSNTDGTFSTPVWLQAEFSARPISDLKVVGDNILNEYPVDFTIKLYTAGNTLVHTETVTGNTEVYWYAEIATHNDVVTMRLEVSKWSKGDASAKIQELFSVYTEEYEGDDLLEITLLEEREYQGSSIPWGNVSANEITVKLNNVDRHFDPENLDSPIHGFIAKNRLIKPYLGIEINGTMNWYPLGKFYSVEWDVPCEGIDAGVRGLDRLDSLSYSTYSMSSVLTNVSLATLATNIFTDAGVDAADYYIDSALESITVPYGWFEPMSHRAALTLIAKGAMAVLYCDRDGIINLKAPGSMGTVSAEYNRDNYISRENPLAWNELVNSVTVQGTPYVADTSQTVCELNDPVVVPAGEQVTVKCNFSKRPCINVGTPTLTGATNTHVESHVDYAWYCNLVLHNSGASPETITKVTITGQPLITKGDISATAENSESIQMNGRSALSGISSVFWQTATRAQEVADYLLESYKDLRKDVILNTRGNPTIKIGDRIRSVTFGDNTADYTVIRQEITWDGGMTSTITGRKINEAS